MKRNKLIFLIIAFIIFVFFAYDFLKGRHISEQYLYEGKSENWKVSSTFTSKGHVNYQSKIIIEYIGKDNSIIEVNSWSLEGTGYGVGGGEQTLKDNKIIKTSDYEDFQFKQSDQQSFSIEWLDEDEEFKLYQKNSNKNSLVSHSMFTYSE
ncbi:hypothetical protein ACQCT6_10015 [Cytobacillus gottheilii]|uniref:hypothetical protein n=1 Tax=Cytobacillus gottheilii TaxID=859144 RepID=UPI002494905A|nr:hypothetical protein [Cytobacillus gottheilii]